MGLREDVVDAALQIARLQTFKGVYINVDQWKPVPSNESRKVLGELRANLEDLARKLLIEINRPGAINNG